MPEDVVTSRKELPDYAKSAVMKIERLGFKWAFDAQYPVPDPDKAQRLQVRDEEHVAPSSEVGKYAAAMKRGDQFPPGIITKDGRFVDFNTRAKAAYRIGKANFPVFILDVDYSTASQSERERLQLLGASCNTTHGRGLTRGELADTVRLVAGNPDWTAERVAAILGVTHGVVNSVFNQFKGEQRAERLGVPLNGTVTHSNKATLGRRSDKLSDQSFREIARLARDAGLIDEELRDLCTRVQEAPDDEKPLIIAADRESRQAQIAHFTATGRKKPPMSSELRKRLGFIFKQADNVGGLLDLNPETSGEYVQQLDQAISILTAVADAQRQALAAQTA